MYVWDGGRYGLCGGCGGGVWYGPGERNVCRGDENGVGGIGNPGVFGAGPTCGLLGNVDVASAARLIPLSLSGFVSSGTGSSFLVVSG